MVQHKAGAAVRQLLTSRPLDWLKWEAICSFRCMWDQWWMKADDMVFFQANCSTSLETPWTQHTYRIYILETHWTQFSLSASHITWVNGPLLLFLILSTTVNALRGTQRPITFSVKIYSSYKIASQWYCKYSYYSRPTLLLFPSLF